MKKELLETIKSEVKDLGIAVVLLIIILKIAFFKEDLFSTIKIGLMVTLLFMIPGYLLGIRWQKKFPFYERIIVGMLFALCASGVLSYYIGLAGLHIKNHMYIMPVAISIIGLGLFLLKEKSKGNAQSKEE